MRAPRQRSFSACNLTGPKSNRLIPLVIVSVCCSPFYRPFGLTKVHRFQICFILVASITVGSIDGNIWQLSIFSVSLIDHAVVFSLSMSALACNDGGDDEDLWLLELIEYNRQAA